MEHIRDYMPDTLSSFGDHDVFGRHIRAIQAVAGLLITQRDEQIDMRAPYLADLLDVIAEAMDTKAWLLDAAFIHHRSSLRARGGDEFWESLRRDYGADEGQEEPPGEKAA